MDRMKPDLTPLSPDERAAQLVTLAAFAPGERPHVLLRVGRHAVELPCNVGTPESYLAHVREMVAALLREGRVVEREQCARVAEAYGAVGWLVYKDQHTVTVVHDTQRIVARAIRERGQPGKQET